MPLLALPRPQAPAWLKKTDPVPSDSGCTALAKSICG
jgi:hypothetical protein